MEETPKPEKNIADELRDLGDNLKNMLQTAWESEEAQKIKDEISSGLEEINKATNEAVEDISSGKTGQRIRDEAAAVRERVKTGEMKDQLRNDILKVLKVINSEIEDTLNSWKAPEEEASDEPEV